MDHRAPGRSPRVLYTLGLLIVIGAGLHVARQILIPVALAMLVAFLLAPIVQRAERLRVPRVVAVVLVMAIGISGVGALGWVLQQQAYQVASQLPQYKQNIVQKLSSMRLTRGSVLDQASKTIAELGREIAGSPAKGEPSRAGAGAPAAEPLSVRVVETPTPPFDYARSLIGPTIEPATTAVIVVVLAAFMLARREDLRDRLVILMGRRTMHLSTPALDDAAKRVSQYLLLQAAVNGCVGLVIGLGLLALGVPGAVLWGVLTVLLRFVPYIGTWVAGAFPIVLSLAVSPDWRQPLMTAGLITVVELVTGQVIEPLLFASRTGLSAIAVLATTLFWTWLWGPVGLLLSTPLTLCVAVLGKHIPRLAFLEVLLADRIELPAESRLYQRLLAGDQEEAAGIVTKFSEGKSLADVYDQLVLPAMRLAEADRHRNELGAEQSEELLRGLTIIVEDHDCDGAASRRDAKGAAVGPVHTLCVPARDAMDALSARMLAQVLVANGVNARALSSDHLTGEVLDVIATQEPRVVCVCAVPPDASVHERVLCKRVRASYPDVPLVAGLWNGELDAKEAAGRLGDIGTEYIATTLAQAAATIPQLAAPIPVVAEAATAA